MPDPKQKMIAARGLFAIAAVCVAVPTLLPAEGDIAQDFVACSRIVEESARLACYDAVSRAQGPEPAVAPAPAQQEEPEPSRAAAVAPEETPAAVHDESAAVHEEDDVVAREADEEAFAPLTDDVGRSDFELRGSNNPKLFRGQVTKCRIGATGSYYFYFDNGQIWKQTDEVRQEFDDCDFSATIKRDMFGYKMQADIEARAVRIKRVK